jgi:hypothetical protein
LKNYKFQEITMSYFSIPQSLLIRIYRYLVFAGIALTMAVSASVAWAQQTPTTSLPSPTANCVVGAQNRYAPLNQTTGQFVLPNLPGNGLIPFGVSPPSQCWRDAACLSGI